MESYSRAYPSLVKLHKLYEIEKLCQLLQEQDVVQRQRTLKKWNWHVRLKLLTPSAAVHDEVLTSRRAVFRILGMTAERGETWLHAAKLARASGNMQLASTAVMNAKQLSKTAQSRSLLVNAYVQNAKLFQSRGHLHQALQELEPIKELFAASKKRVPSSANDNDRNRHEEDHLIARGALLQVKWLQESGSWVQDRGSTRTMEIVKKYQNIIAFRPEWEQGYLALGQYYDFLLRKSDTDRSSSKDQFQQLKMRVESSKYLYQVLENYGRALKYGHKRIFHSLPRLLTLWFQTAEETVELEALITKTPRGSDAAATGLLQELRAHIKSVAALAVDLSATLPAYQWLTALPQLTSRLCHKSTQVQATLHRILVRILTTYTAHALWAILGVSKSSDQVRQKKARMVIEAVIRKNRFKSTQLQGANLLFDELIALCKSKVKSRTKSIPLPTKLKSIDLERLQLLMPILRTLTPALPPHNHTIEDDQRKIFTDFQITLVRFGSNVEVLPSKEKPKKLEAIGNDGSQMNFLCKMEVKGDMRKDCRIMEFNSVINRLLSSDTEGRRRKLNIRTFAVVLLTDKCALIEWVPNTAGLRKLITKVYTQKGHDSPCALTINVRAMFERLQNSYAHDIGKMVQKYRTNITPKFPRLFHEWFISSTADPMKWFEKRLMFSRSCAVWSILGHIVGLGDRHGENVMCDERTGECVHVDFDCLFDKGLTLGIPEVVPFRLSPNMVDALGVTSYEGVFRRVCEITLRVARSNKDALMSVLEAFVYDPLVEWTSKRRPNSRGRQIRKDMVGENGLEASHGRKIMLRIEKRLCGVYNTHELVQKLRRPQNKTKKRHSNAIGTTTEKSIELSIQGECDA